MNHFPLETVKPEVFKHWVEMNRKTWKTPNARINKIALAGSDLKAQVFFEPVAIGVFSRIVGLPISTVRLYVRRGLIEPIVVSGKYRFLEWNVAQAEAVKLWSELGVTLDRIFQRKLELRKENPELCFSDILEFSSNNGQGYGVGLIHLIKNGNGFGYSIACRTMFEGEQPVGDLAEHPAPNHTPYGKFVLQTICAEAKAFFAEARLALEAEQQKLEARIARAKLFEERLAQPFFDSE
jgi:DNA-binding transcriptional MerR regulator